MSVASRWLVPLTVFTLRWFGLASVLFGVANFALRADDWPQWLGPSRNAFAREHVSPWTEPLRIAWRQPVGEGHSSPIVADGRVFLHTKVTDKEAEQVTALDANTGRILWTQTYPRQTFSSIFGNGPRATPAVDHGSIYTYGVTGILAAFDVASGKPRWSIDTQKEWQSPPLFFGVSCSPLIVKDRLFVSGGGKGAGIVALNTEDGSIAWKKLDDRPSYSSPIAISQDGQPLVVFLTQQGVVALGQNTGRLAWRFPLVDVLNESSATPVWASDIVLASSITYGTAALRLTGHSPQLAVKELWKNPELTCYFATPIIDRKGTAYVVTGTKPPAVFVQATLHCIDAATGKERWNRPKVGKYHASLLRLEGGRMLMLEDSGNLCLLDTSAPEYRELARSKICGDTWVHPALAKGRLYVRDQKELLCVQMKP